MKNIVVKDGCIKCPFSKVEQDSWVCNATTLLKLVGAGIRFRLPAGQNRPDWCPLPITVSENVPEGALSEREWAELRATPPRLISAIKLVKARLGCNLIEAKKVVDRNRFKQ